MKKLIILSLLLITSIKVFSQNKITQTREITGFTFIHLQVPATLYVTQENHFTVQVAASQEALERINTEVKENTLVITSERNSSGKNTDLRNGKEDVIIYISLPKPNGLQVFGSGIIKAQNNFLTDYLSIEVHGSGTIVMKDFKTQKAHVSVEGSGEIYHHDAVAQGLVEEVNGSGKIIAASLMSSMTSLSVSGSGEMKTENIQSEKLEAVVHGSGHIRLVAGTAKNILLEIVGSGNIISGDVVGGTVSAAMSGSGSISIGVMDALNASVAGSGAVNYKGNPSSVSKSISGSGSVKKM